MITLKLTGTMSDISLILKDIEKDYIIIRKHMLSTFDKQKVVIVDIKNKGVAL